MKSIKITADNIAKIESALGDLATMTHTHSAEQIVAAAEAAEGALEFIPKKYRAGATATDQSGDQLPNSYRHSRICSVISMERRSSEWFLTGISRVTAYKEAGKLAVSITKEQETIMVSHLLKANMITVRPE